ncbi:MAG: PfkB family carbohydrate kinase, partial [bacterium]|nr:PfkB family carbohydrate kinase [bacterium]
LAESGVDIAGVLVDDTRVTTCKTRVIAHSQQVVRLDREQRHPVSENLHQELMRRFAAVLPRASAVVISDYQKGVLTPAVTREAVERCLSAEVLVTANPKPPLLRHLRGAHLVSINLQEAQSFAHSVGNGMELLSLAQVSTFVQEWRQTLGVGALVVTLGAEGMLLCTESDTGVHVPAMPVEVYDTAGAGDTVIATLTCALSAGADWLTAAQLATAAASSVVRHVGVVPPRRDEILRLLSENHSGKLA